MTVRFNTVDVGCGIRLSATIFRDAQRPKLEASGESFSERLGNNASRRFCLFQPLPLSAGMAGLGADSSTSVFRIARNQLT
jgi:hypothetical protein